MSKSSSKGSQRLYTLDESHYSNKIIRYLAIPEQVRNASRCLDRSQLKPKIADGRVQEDKLEKKPSKDTELNSNEWKARLWSQTLTAQIQGTSFVG